MARRRCLRLDDLDHVAREARALLHTGYDPVGTWSLAQVSQHLSTFMRMSIEGFPPIHVPWFIRAGGAVGKFAVLKHRWIPAGFKAPVPLLPVDAANDATAVDALVVMLARVRDHSGAWHASPLFGPLTSDQWRLVHLVHAEHHLSFLVPKHPS